MAKLDQRFLSELLHRCATPEAPSAPQVWYAVPILRIELDISNLHIRKIVLRIEGLRVTDEK